MVDGNHVATPPVKPRPTIVLLCSLAFWLGCAIAYGAGAGSSAEECLQRSSTLLPAALAVIALAFPRKTRTASLLIAAICAGGLMGCGGAASIHAATSTVSGLNEEWYVLTLLEDSVDYGYGETARVSCSLPNGKSLTFDATFKRQDAPLFNGDTVAASSVTFEPADFEDDEWAWREGSCAKATVTGGELLSPHTLTEPLRFMRKSAIDAIGGESDSKALLQAIVCGYRRNIKDTSLYECFKACGLAHLVAVSGAHLVIVTAMFASCLKALRVRRQVSVAIIALITAAYLVFSGAPISAIRAASMSSIGSMSLFAHRRPSAQNALGVCVFAIVGTSPSAALSASLALSALSTLGIVLFAPLIGYWLSCTPLRLLPFAADALALTCASSIASLPYSISLFYVLPTISPIANIISAPIFSVVCALGLISGLAAIAWLPLAQGLIVPTAFLADVLCGIVRLIAHVPYGCVPFYLEPHGALVISAFLGLALLVLWPKPSAKYAVGIAVSCLLCFSALVFQVNAEDSITVLNVGQGDAILVRSAGKTLLVDTGNQQSMLLRELGKNHVARIDGLLITHADDDHYGCMETLGLYAVVSKVLVADGMQSSQADKAKEIMLLAREISQQTATLAYGDRMAIGKVEARVVWPQRFSDDGANSDSVCLLLEYDGQDDGRVDANVLLMGDAECEQLAEMVKYGDVGRVDVLKVGHHGSKNSLNGDLAHVLQPRIAAISCGKRNRYGHPADVTLDLLSAVGAKVYRTDVDGEIRCTLSCDGIQVARVE